MRVVGGLTTDEIARACLVSSTMGKRLVRAKRKIAEAGIPWVRSPNMYSAKVHEHATLVHEVVGAELDIEAVVGRKGWEQAQRGVNRTTEDLLQKCIHGSRVVRRQGISRLVSATTRSTRSNI